MNFTGIESRTSSLQVPVRIGADILGGRLSGNLCHCWQATPTVRWHRDAVNTKNKDHAEIRSFTVAGPFIWNSLPAALRTTTLSLLTFTRHLKAHLFSWSTAHLRTIYDVLYKSAHHHHQQAVAYLWSLAHGNLWKITSWKTRQIRVQKSHSLDRQQQTTTCDFKGVDEQEPPLNILKT